MPRRTVSVRTGEGFLDFVAYGRQGPGHRDRLLPAQIAMVARTVRRAPEVMVKVSGGGTSTKAVLAHFKYLTRREFVIETDDGQRLKGRCPERSLVDDWDLELDAAESRSPYRGAPGRRPTKLVHNVVLSMPVGTPAKGLIEASRAFAREQFALKHRYAMVLHTDQPHPHVHLVIKAMSEQGRRLNIRKATLRQWREEFARHLRAQGIEANATARTVRGVLRPEKPDGIYWAMREGRSTYREGQMRSIARALAEGKIQDGPIRARLTNKRNAVLRGWLAVRDELRREGRLLDARQVEQFLIRMPPLQTERESIAGALTEHLRKAQLRNRLDLAR